MGSSAHENKPWSDKYTGYTPEELSPVEESMTCSFEEPVRCVPGVDAPRRFGETISYSELDDFADRFVYVQDNQCEGSLATEIAKGE